jgi:predicted glycosyltransferase
LESTSNIAIFINTPAQLHFYKNIADRLVGNGNKLKILFRKYGETLELAKELDFEPVVFSTNAESKYGKVASLPFDVIRAYRYLKAFKPDVVTGFGVYDAYTSFLLRSNCIVFNDSEPRSNPLTYSMQFKVFMPFVDVLLTPESFQQNLGAKHLRVASYKELAYLHPNYYMPKDDIFDLLRISRGEDYVLLRFNSFDAVHDIGIKGFTREDKIELVRKLGRYAHVFVSSERKVPREIKDRVLTVPKSRIHDVIYYAKLMVTDTQTMATEGALLGTPTIRSNQFVGEKDMGNFIELEKRFGLLFNIGDPKEVIKKAEELIQTDDIKREWQRRRKRLLEKKIDMTAFMVWFIENYPESLYKFRENPQIQYRFR